MEEGEGKKIRMVRKRLRSGRGVTEMKEGERESDRRVHGDVDGDRRMNKHIKRKTLSTNNFIRRYKDGF